MSTTEPRPADADERWESDVVLADGGTVHVRPITPADRNRLLALHGRLSAESIYYRFFSPKPRLTDKEVEKFTNVDMHDRVALVATLGDDIIGVGRYDRWPGKPEAEVAFTVDDAHHGRGLATVLLEHLATIGRSRGLARFTAEVLPDNRAMLSVFRKAGFEVTNEFSGGIIDVAFDIEETPGYLETVEQRERRAESRSISRLLRPRSIAVVGASDRPGSVGAAIFQNLLSSRFDGPVYPVNPFVHHVSSVLAYDSVLDVPDDVHLAVIAVPADQVVAVVTQCAEKKVRGCLVVSTGFAEVGNDEAQRALVELARGNGMRLIGPASMGLVTTPSSVRASFASVPVDPGRVAMSVQSGPFGIALLELAHRMGIGISTFVSLGNKADVSANDLLNYWDEDPDTDVVLLYTESFGNPRKFGRIARRVGRHKPVVAVKAGRRGPDDDAADALYQQAGVIRVPTVRELFHTGRLLASQPLPAGTRVAVVSNAASPAVLVLDGLDVHGLEVAALSADTRAELAAHLPTEARVGAVVDLTFRAVPADYRAAVSTVLADDGVDACVVVYAPPIVDGVEDVAAAVDEAAAEHAKTVVACALGHDDGPLSSRSTTPNFSFPEPACAALGRVARYSAWRARPLGTVPELDVDLDVAREVVSYALERRPAGTLLPLPALTRLLMSHGIPFAAARAVTSRDGAVVAAAELGFPVTLKAAGLTRLARSESGGVALDLHDAEAVDAAYGRMSDALGPAMAEAIVQRMAPAGVEICIGVEHHPAFGPVVSFGLGGAYYDAIADRAVRAVPLTDLDALELVTTSRAMVALEALGADLDALQAVLLRVAQLADELPELTSLRLNPVLASRAGAWTVDARAHVTPTQEQDQPLRRLS
jgi:acyl-CoA synthetase (NDP forming)/RimJ/RimL family protein N-acetyltransferase